MNLKVLCTDNKGDDPTMAQVTVKADAGKQYKQEIEAGTHSFTSDAPTEVGGTGQGPEPHELLLAALGSCTSITVQMYAQRKGWDLKGISVKLKEEKIADPENESRSMPKIVREIELKGALEPDQVDALKAIADKCPIHKLLSGPKQIATEVNLAK